LSVSYGKNATLKNFFSELKRRKVFKLGAAYLIVAWLAVQAASIGFPAFDAPPWALRVFILIALLGFPITVVMAWVFDVTRQGVKLDARTSGSKALFAVAALLIVLALGWYFYGQPSFRKGDAATPTIAGHNSIAVLPFVNISGKADEDYFSDGMTEELLNVLAKIPKLNVVARTSVFEFKGKGGDVREIGRKLGVSHIVEGSVRRDREQVRVTAQLVRVADGFHLWADTYDRELENVFALQDDIAKQVARQLQTRLGFAPPAPTRAAIEPAAYDEYLRGRALLRSRKDLPAAIAHFKAAVAQAPDFAAAWASLSLTYEVSFWFTHHMTPAREAEWLAGQATAADRAAALEPDAATTEHALGNVARAQFHYADAERHYLRAMQIDPNYSDVREDYSELLYEVGRLEDSMRAGRQLVTLDPYFAIGWNRIVRTATALDRRADVEEAVRQMRAISPDNYWSKLGLLNYLVAYRRADEARAELAEIGARWPKDAVFAQTLLPWALGEPVIDQGRLRAAIADAPPGAAASYFIARQDIDGFNAYFETLGAIRQQYYFIDLYGSKPTGHAMLRDPRVKAMLVRYGFPAYWREKGWPAGCRPLGETDFECGVDTANGK
jgi:TolB-like protein/tetratricopeptide (TPR) repeat protein